jgi:hypothetical protein
MEEVVPEMKCMACGKWCDRRAPGRVICQGCAKKHDKSNPARKKGSTRPMGVDEFAKSAGGRLLKSQFPESIQPYVDARVGQTLVKDGKWYIHISFVKSGVGSAGNHSSEATPCSR